MNHVRANAKLIAISALAGCVLMLIAGYVVFNVMNGQAASSDWEDWFMEEAATENAEQEETDEQSGFDQPESSDTVVDDAFYIDVKGAVRRPGVYRLLDGSRVLDAVMEAGGFIDDAAYDGINLAQKLHDEMVVFVPYVYQEEQMEGIPFATEWTVSENEKDGAVCLNSSDQAELETLPGIGPSKAAAIISYREEAGAFSTIDELKNVPGIGDKTFVTLESLIQVTPGSIP
ncbi:helix-hairpin-helix domain-containing protein [Salisediminibacterium beveridgei]|nr:helix-hairpin-helix domain-containing protein [Salisediminibacterium beveridgei]